MSAHLNEEQITNWLIGEKTAEIHVAECERCAAEIERAEIAFAMFRDSATALAECGADAPVRTRPPGRAPASPRWGWPIAAAVALIVAVIALHQPAPTASRGNDAPFMQIPYVAPPAPYERTEILRMDVQVAALTTAGFDVHMPDPGASVPAEVLVGQDGRPYAIRFLPSSFMDNNRRTNQ